MTLIALCADEDGILLLGDRLRLEENNRVPQADTTKVFLTCDQKVCFALYGAVPIRDGHGVYRTDRWLADFVTKSIPRGSSPLYAAVRLEHALRNPALGNKGASGGGFLIAGYEGDKASAFEIICKSKSDADPTLDIGSWELPQAGFWRQPLLRGCLNDYGAARQEANADFPASQAERIAWFGNVVDALSRKGEPVGGQAEYVTIGPIVKPSLPVVEAESPIQGSLQRIT